VTWHGSYVVERRLVAGLALARPGATLPGAASELALSCTQGRWDLRQAVSSPRPCLHDAQADGGSAGLAENTEGGLHARQGRGVHAAIEPRSDSTGGVAVVA